jgi:MFS family permease
MTATPLAMKHYGFKFSQTVLTVQCHLLGMFVPGFFSGFVIDALKPLPTIILGMFALIGSACILYTMQTFSHFMSGLAMVGLGWNLGFISGTRLLLEVPKSQAEAVRIQAINEFFVMGSSACASFLSGFLFTHFGWKLLNVITVCFAVIVILVSVLMLFCQRKSF